MYSRTLIWVSSCFLFLLANAALAGSTHAVPATLTFGIVPQQASAKLARLWIPIIQDISDKTGYPIQFKTAPNIPEFERRLAKGEYDLAYMNPYHYLVFSKSPGYRAFAKQKGKKIVGILVTSKSDPVTSLRELEGKTLAFPSPSAFAASILPRAFLRKAGISFQVKYVSSHDSVYHNVSRGLFPAGGGIIRTLKNSSANIQAKLAILWQSPGYTPHAFAAHPRISQDVIQRIREVMVKMDQSAEGQGLLGAIKFKGIEASVPGDWDDIRELVFTSSIK
ncbi:MAG: phosphate/phosphite/phosphonate ABC transporter substrate-binding protein [Candidatus Thiodiazotropha sp. (ex Dulcina madagascariensis)]|nr:phosphate/phosphite/phosphonate ABC transporter substrate-binding protein [Candidatus Thiodiazotropha sp. (ex Dulcina madagascariensis)]